ncbi:NAD(P)/FAD-dependent oxidoreductase [Sneathiella glossodoripedis]|uniref:NAD(P)/FAD-dependent oxidoreductase n=1 Tax=Sneathiella glossodoripedis TaxID=418853 RepID=UPI00046E8A82|nr:FAD-binding oxidoreductase [Sneathiella glossodoripedis]
MQASVCDIIVIGAGIAGASVAAELAETSSVVLLERETQPGYHTTGRSAALYSCIYGPPVIRGLSRASGAFFENPNSEFVSSELLKPRGLYFVARSDQAEAVEATLDELGAGVQEIALSSARLRLPLLRNEYVDRVLFEEGSADIDVDALHQHYLKLFRHRGGSLSNSTEVVEINKISRGWEVVTTNGKYQAETIVNAAGAWGDEIARLASVAPVGLVPKRRTALLVSPPEGCEVDHWPMVVDIDEKFYMKPDAGKLLISPADETPSAPCDAQPEDLDVAICVDRIEKAFDLPIRRIDHKWAGLRSFVADKCPVAGFEPGVDGFFWLVGQGGYGIQSAPALARAASSLILGRALPQDIQDEGVTEKDLSREREGLAA